MATLPSAYVDNISLLKTDTVIFRGNRISDCYGANIHAIHIQNCTNLIAKDNQAVRIRSNGGVGKGFEINDCDNAILLYNVASRVDVGFDLISVATLNIYNLTAHNCDIALEPILQAYSEIFP